MDQKPLEKLATKPVAYYSPAQLAARWQVTGMTLRRWRKAGKIKALHIGRGVRFSIAEVERFEREALA
ncbi:MAG: helix-turn-helix domain-containing protein [Prosthecobacter sp.]|uniref:helix-turn-helix domain-containing protein n=1 Tax=Prosthecobacter sp. TaxID=1965333 RepID=UPI003BAE47D3